MTDRGWTPKNRIADRKNLGRCGEDLAVDYLRRRRYRILDRCFRLHRGEIDIIAADGDCLVFIEVKTRRSPLFGSPEESVTPAKQRQIKKIAEGYLVYRGLSDAECRFDVISVLWDSDRPSLTHIPNAFE